MNKVGIYFGPQMVSVVETNSNHLVESIRIALSDIYPGQLQEEKVLAESKIASLLKEELNRKKIEAKEAVICLSGKDLIIRSFEVPILPRLELEGAVNFEVRKYIPFKIEELFSDFQFKLDKGIKKYHVLFVGVKKETLDKYEFILKEVGIKAAAVEYSAFSALRMLSLSDFKEKGVIANIDVDFAENDEVSFVVLEDGFPLFSRDITLLSDSKKELSDSAADPSAIILEKLKREIRISLDYYDRIFPLKNINKIFFVTSRDHRMELETFIKEMGFGVQFINFEKFSAKYIGKTVPFSLPFIKGYCSSLIKVDSAVKINLLAAKERTLKKAIPESKVSMLGSQLRPYLFSPIAGTVILLLVFMAGIYRLSPMKKELKIANDTQPAVALVSAQDNYDSLTSAYSVYEGRIRAAGDILKGQVFFSELLDVIPRLLPQDLWLKEALFQRKENQVELILRGIVYTGDSNKELETVNEFLSGLKTHQLFVKYFKSMDIVSIDREKFPDSDVTGTNFSLVCKK